MKAALILMVLVGMVFMVEGGARSNFLRVNRHAGERASGNDRCSVMPAQMSAGYAEVVSNSKLCVEMTAVGQLYLDFNRQQARADLIGESMGSDFNVSTWLMYKTQKMYTLDRDSGKCYEAPFMIPLGSNVIPSNAKYLNSFFIGSQEFDSYYVPNYSGSQFDVEMSVTSGSCLLVSSVVSSTNSSQPTVLESLWNIVPQVPQYIFDMPSACSSSESHRMTRDSLPVDPVHFAPFY